MSLYQKKQRFAFVSNAQGFAEFVESMDDKQVQLAFPKREQDKQYETSYIHHKYRNKWKPYNASQSFWVFLWTLDPGNTNALINYVVSKLQLHGSLCNDYEFVLGFFKNFASSWVEGFWFAVFDKPKNLKEATWIQFCRHVPLCTFIKASANDSIANESVVPIGIFDLEPLVKIIYDYAQHHSEMEFYYTRLTRTQQEAAFNLMYYEWYGIT